MEVVKVFNRDGESYHRFETDVKNYRDFTLDWFRACWLWMALYTSILPCVALVLLPAGGYLVLTGAPPCRITRWYCACLFPWDRL